MVPLIHENRHSHKNGYIKSPKIRGIIPPDCAQINGNGIRVANATVEKLMDSEMDFMLDEIVGGLKALDFIDVVEGNNVVEFDQAVIKRMTDKNTKELFDVTIQHTRRSKNKDLLKKIDNKEVKCVLVYDQREDNNPDCEPHCVFIDKLVNIGGRWQWWHTHMYIYTCTTHVHSHTCTTFCNVIR